VLIVAAAAFSKVRARRRDALRSGLDHRDQIRVNVFLDVDAHEFARQNVGREHHAAADI
jgi:dienelactone hydrolase